MKDILALLFLVLGTRCASAGCGIDEYRCCFTEFLTLVSNRTGIQLTEEKINTSCKIHDATITCIEEFEYSCNDTISKDFLESINKTKVFVDEMCSMTSNYNMDVKASERCFVDSSDKFIDCTRKKAFPEVADSDENAILKADCCEYMNLRNCAVQVVENACGQSASETLQKEVTAINGAGLEFACTNLFSQCESSAVSVAQPAMFLLSLCFASVVFVVSLL